MNTLHPWVSLARLDRPIGIWLLLWPCLWSLALAPIPLFEAAWLFVLFVCGAILMRSAGCVFNDIVDRRIDAQVRRTQNRPLPRGTLSLVQAVFLLLLLLVGAAAILLQFNTLTIFLGLLSLPLVALYPFTKRWSPCPQFFLGLTFGWGALMGWSAATNSLNSWTPFFLYGAAIAWTLGYDTIYAHQDKDDDKRLGLKSTALLFGNTTVYWLAVFYTLTVAALATAGFMQAATLAYYLLLLLATTQLFWQLYRFNPKKPQLCMTVFTSNRTFGAIIFLACLSQKEFINQY